MDSYQSVVSQMHSAAVLIGMTSKTEVIGVADGGKGLSEELKRQFPSMQFILDKSHFRDHLYETAEDLGIKQEKRPAWVNPRLKSVADGNVDEVLKNLEDENKKKPNKRRTRLIGYIKRFFDSLDYSRFKSKGYPIGSGEIESAQNSVAQKRLKIGTIRIYSSYPIKNGVFVSTSYQQALDYADGDKSKVHSRLSSINSVAWINGDEGQYAKTSKSTTTSEDIRYSLTDELSSTQNQLLPIENANTENTKKKIKMQRRILWFWGFIL
jgi:hypothetical protein